MKFVCYTVITQYDVIYRKRVSQDLISAKEVINGGWIRKTRTRERERERESKKRDKSRNHLKIRKVWK
jgi:hypothetical protein